MFEVLIVLLLIAGIVILLGFDKLMDIIAGIFMVAMAIIVCACLLVVMLIIGIIGIPLTIGYAIWTLCMLACEKMKEILENRKNGNVD